MALWWQWKSVMPGFDAAEIDLGCAVRFDNDYVLAQAGHRLAVEARHFKRVPVQMYRMIVGAAVLHHKPVALALVERDRFGLRK